MAKDKGNAGDYSYGDMLRDTSELEAITGYEVVDKQDVDDEETAKGIRRRLGPEARRKGLVIDIKEVKHKGGGSHWEVTVERPIRGKKK